MDPRVLRIFDEDEMMEEIEPEFQEEINGDRPVPELVWWEDWDENNPLGLNFTEWAQWLSENADNNQREDVKRCLRVLNDQMREACLNLWLGDHQTIMGVTDNYTFLMENDLDDYNTSSREILRKLSAFIEYMYLLVMTTLEEE